MDGARPRTRITVRTLPATPRESRAVSMAVARALGLSLTEARALLERVPATLPKALEAAETDALLHAVQAQGARADAGAVEGDAAACSTHPSLDAEETCTRCHALICMVCAATGTPAGQCPACSR